jgi:D-aminopeptidase
MTSRYKHILIVADIEGSSGCWDYRASSFRTPEWARACVDMTRDVAAIVDALFRAGVDRVIVKDFHRTGYNLLPGVIDARAEIIYGYRRRPVPGFGDPGGAEAVIFTGMHAASGSDGFLAHTLTSRIARLEVNGNLMAEVELFSSVLAQHGIRPIFFSGCPVACYQAAASVDHISTYPIAKSNGPEDFDAVTWRAGLARSAAEALNNELTQPLQPDGPLRALVKMRDGAPAARKIANRWNFEYVSDQIILNAPNMQSLYVELIRICFLTPLIEKVLPIGLIAYNLRGRLGLYWVQRQIKYFRGRGFF